MLLGAKRSKECVLKIFPAETCEAFVPGGVQLLYTEVDYSGFLGSLLVFVGCSFVFAAGNFRFLDH